MPIIFDILNCLTPRVAAPAYDIERHQQDEPPHTRSRYQDDQEHPNHPDSKISVLVGILFTCYMLIVDCLGLENPWRTGLYDLDRFKFVNIDKNQWLMQT